MKIASSQFIRLGYHIAGRKDTPLQIQHLRDGATFSEISVILQNEGFTYGSTIFNWPLQETREPGKSVDTTFIKSNDLIVLTTRPPLDDANAQNKKQVKKSDTQLENNIFENLRQFLKVCDREHVRLAETWADKLSARFSNRAEIIFKQNGGAEIQGYKKYHDSHILKKKNPQNKTMFYIINIPQLWDNGPGLFCSFGMRGQEALIGAYLLRTKYWNRLDFSFDSPRMAMLEITLGEIPFYPNTLDFADSWHVDILLNDTLN
jgi:hypothetical protein